LQQEKDAPGEGKGGNDPEDFWDGRRQAANDMKHGRPPLLYSL